MGNKPLKERGFGAWGRKFIEIGLIGILVVGAFGCGGAKRGSAGHTDGRDTIKKFGNGRFQIAEGPPKSYYLLDGQTGEIVVDEVAKWKEQEQFAYMEGGKPTRFYVLDLSMEKLAPYPNLADMPASHRAVFEAWDKTEK